MPATQVQLFVNRKPRWVSIYDLSLHKLNYSYKNNHVGRPIYVMELLTKWRRRHTYGVTVVPSRRRGHALNLFNKGAKRMPTYLLNVAGVERLRGERPGSKGCIWWFLKI